MKKITFVTVLLFSLSAVCSASFAQEKLDEFMTQTSPEERAQMQTEYMKENLSLTGMQLPLVSEINLAYSKKMQAAYEGETGKFKRLKKLKSVADEKDSALKKVLEPTQYELYTRNKEAMKEKLKARAKEKRKG